jgi:hypothetical protein
VKVLIGAAVVWLLLVLAVIVAVSTNRIAAWDIYLIFAIVILGLAVVVAILMLP